MKKGFPIFLSIFMLAAILHLSVATHYCGGKEVASVISFSGKLASCDMECSEMHLPLIGTNFSKHCCVDVRIFFGIDNNYTPSFSFVPESYQCNSQVFTLNHGLPVSSYTDLFSFSTNVSPPGALTSTYVDLSEICVFRI